MPTKLAGLARRLVSEKLVDERLAVLATAAAREQNTSLVSHLVSSNLIAEETIALAAAEEFGLPVFKLDSFDIQSCPEKIVDAELIKRHHLLPLSVRCNRLFLASADPGDTSAINELAFHCGFKVEIIVVEVSKLASAIERYLQCLDRSYEAKENISDGGLDNIEIDLRNKLEPDEELNTFDETPLVRFINKLLLEAIAMQASDIHFEPYESIYRIRFRIDGLLREMTRPPVKLTPRLASRIKIMARLDISEKRLPQDGRIRILLAKKRVIDLRVNTLPTLWGEKIVMRILDPMNTSLGLDSLGMEPIQQESYLHALHRPQGLILVTGPTGSGKTFSLYCGLKELNIQSKNISTVEDPIEITIEGINQLAVNHKSGLSFASALRALLRQDPDVIMLGEVRDTEAAEIAIRAAQTGHLVLTTLHTLSAAASLSRLRNIGIPAYNLANTITLVIAQRLARRLCNYCKESIEMPERALIEQGFTTAQLSSLTLYRAQGCKHCQDGYSGRVGFYEVVPISEDLSRIIMEDSLEAGVSEYIRREGFLSLRDSVLVKVAGGVTSLEEANRLT